MRRAFTLFELLMVIAIIALLAGILFPVIATVKGSASASTALSQMREIGRAVSLYANDQDGRLPMSANYGAPQAKGRLWTTGVQTYAKSEAIFTAPTSEGKFAKSWAERGTATIGLNSSTAFNANGCRPNEQDMAGCQAFAEALSLDGLASSTSALLACTPGGDTEKGYRGFEFNPYNGTPNLEKPKQTPPLVSDRDLVAALEGFPGDQLKPIFARYGSTGKDDGRTPIVFADGSGKSFSAKQLAGKNSGIIWQLR